MLSGVVPEPEDQVAEKARSRDGHGQEEARRGGRRERRGRGHARRQRGQAAQARTGRALRRGWQRRRRRRRKQRRRHIASGVAGSRPPWHLGPEDSRISNPVGFRAVY